MARSELVEIATTTKNQPLELAVLIWMAYLPEASTDQTTLEIDGNNNRVNMQTSRPLALVGVSGLVIIENKNGILIMDPKKAINIQKVAKYFDV